MINEISLVTFAITVSTRDLHFTRYQARILATGKEGQEEKKNRKIPATSTLQGTMPRRLL